jgi:hypothetical protein
MRRGLAVVGVALAVVLAFKSLVAPSGVLTPPTNQISISSLYVARSDAMKSMSADIIALP